ncbi:YidC/Oxa1 family membrane protein insertase [Thermoactinomyces sp. CICC 10523]|uniref:YidC/Oxa1 family membrane protein insertase n=1 Tax=Thermoactinomyces sp. CICC 10523 TaxID=2767428 RepID=UPI0018DCD0FB|nr:YidC/Oxa1 family membrane protein insertase [Thermoactinomyces sp. CICC 10523]MBH8598499.1 membrane protein insertase YidC [Thermoactinomyces sp. CICC 10523]
MTNWTIIQKLAHLLQPAFDQLYQWLGDWGLALIFFTLLVRVCLIPVSLRTARLMASQFVFSRKAAELQKTWTGSKEELSGEIANLMQKHKFNPFSMLLNALLQSPILVAVFAVFSHLGAQASSVLVPWVDSIGLRDPWHLLPLIIALLTGLASRVSLIPREYTPNGQAKMNFFLMAGIALFILWSAPVATALYYGTSSLWGVLERKALSRYTRKLIEAQTEVSTG